MPFVIDTNQASLLPRLKDQDWVLSLSPYVLAEILLRRNPRRTLELLSIFPFRPGLELLDVMVQLSQSSAREIRSFEPFVGPRQKYRQNYDVMVSAMNCVRTTHIDWAKYIKESHRRYMSILLGNALRFRKRARELGMSKVKHSTFGEALSAYASDTESFLGSVVVGSITYDGRRTTKMRPEGLFEAVMENQYLARFFRVKLAYILSVSRVWKAQELNFDPSPERDDMTDITLLLYAADGDLILSADNTLSMLVALIESERGVKVCRVEDVARKRG